MNTLTKILIAAGIIASFSLNAMAADVAPPPKTAMQEHMERMNTLSPEDRAKEREAMHQEMQKLTPEQRAEKHKEMHEYMEKLSPKERATRRKEMRERFDKMSPKERKQFRKDMQGNMTPGMMPADCPEKSPAK